MTRPVFIDFETASAADLRSVGGRRYASHTSTRVLCLCASWDLPNGTARNLAWVPSSLGLSALPHFTTDGTEIVRGDEIPEELALAVRSIGSVAAHNANSFDRHVWDKFVKVRVPTWVDTIHLARAAGLPAGLDKLGQWFGLGGKDEGSAVLKKVMRLEWDDKLQDWSNKFIAPGSVATVVRYCVRDVDLLRTIWDRVTSDGDACDAGAIEFDQRVNDFGVGFDERLAARIATVSTQLVTESGQEIERLTNGALKATDLRSIPKVKAWLETHGVSLQNLRRETVESFIANPDSFITGQDDTDEYEPAEDAIGVTPEVMQVLRLRNSALRVTGAKLERASAACINGRLFDLFGYHQAHTGRWSSRLMQVHNLPSGVSGANLPALCDNLTLEAVKAEAIRLTKLDDLVLPDDVLSTLVRLTLIPTTGYEFVIGDFASIESRVLAWCAGERSLISAFEEGKDPYKLLASIMYKIDIADVTKEQRQAGKVAVLGCGYGMGHKRLNDFAHAVGIDLAAAGTTPEKVVDGYRSAFPAIAGVYDGEYEGRPMRKGGIWRDVEKAFRDVTSGEVPVAYAARCKFTRNGCNTIITLPSGRRLTYRRARFETYEDQFGRTRQAIVFTGGRGDVRTYGGKLVENIVQAIARDLLRDAGIAVQRKWNVPLHVHDELVAEAKIGEGKKVLKEMLQIMSTAPEWAPGLPLGAEGHVAPRYTKSKWEIQ